MFIQNHGKCLEIVAVSLDHSRSIVVVTIGSEVESLLKVSRGRSWRRSETTRYRSEECVSAVRSVGNAWLAGSRSLSTYLPARRSLRISSYIRCTRVHRYMFLRRARGNRDCQKRPEDDPANLRRFLSEPESSKIAPYYARAINIETTYNRQF